MNGEAAIARVTETWRAKLFYGVGTIAYGVKDNAFQVYLLYYYTLVHQLSAAAVATALLIAVMLDSVTDPLVGQFSDNVRTRLGKRHPFMFIAAVPAAASFYFLWLPPENLSETQMFWYLLVTASLSRLFITFYEIPATALVSELTQDYDQRVQFASLRYFFGWIGGAGISVFALSTIFADTPAHPDGLANAAAYGEYALLGSVLMIASILLSSLGTVGYVPHLIEDKSARIEGLGPILRNLISALTDRVFAPLFGTALLFAMGLGVSVSLVLFFNTYFWDFTTGQIATLGLSFLVGAGIAPIAAPLATRGKLGKRRAAMLLGSCAAILIPLPVFLRLLGLMPENGSPLLVPILFTQSAIVIGLGVAAEILVQAMVADVVEDNERRTGRRSAGVFFAARTFASKSTNGLGVLIGGVIVSIAGLEKGMSREAATPDMVSTLGEIYVPVIAAIYVTSILLLRRFTITRDRHKRNLQALGRHSSE